MCHGGLHDGVMCYVVVWWGALRCNVLCCVVMCWGVMCGCVLCHGGLHCIAV